MKCKLIREGEKTVEATVRGKKRLIHLPLPIGTIIDHPDAYVLCDLGTAEPFDEECVEAASKKTPEQLAADSANRDAVEAGIHPEDLDLFKAGMISGYRPEYDPNTEPPSMMFAHGPNWTDAVAAEIDGDDEDEPSDEPSDETDAK